MNPIDTHQQLDEFAFEHSKRARHLSEADERRMAENLMRNLSRFEWYREAFTPTARMAHERMLLDMLAVQSRREESNCDRDSS